MKRKPRRKGRIPWLAVAVVTAYFGVVVATACDGSSETFNAGGSGGGFGGATTTSTPTSTTAAGAGGGGQDAGGGFGGAGTTPVWEPLAQSIVGCTLERITNAPEVRLFHLEPCSDQPSCQALVMSPIFGNLGHTAIFEAGWVQEADTGTVFSINLRVAPDYLVLFARPDGWLIDGYKILGAGGCYGGMPGSNRTRYGFEVDQGTLPHRLGGLLNALDQSAAPVTFETVPTPTGIGPQIWQAWGDDRWVWEFYPDRLDTISVQDGSGLYTMAASASGGPILAVNFPTTPGPVFYFEQVNLVPPNSVQGIIAQSDGLQPSAPYLVPSDGSYYGHPAYAHSHIGWLRGIGQTDVNQFAEIEVWASPYSANPANLSPQKVDDYPGQAMPELWGGHGYLAAVSAADAPTYNETAVWHLSDATKRIFQYPGGRKVNRYLGITEGYVWVVGRDLSVDYADMIVRFVL
jgi:hypothetical protein